MTVGRRRRFEQVYAEHRTALLGYVLRRTGSGEDAADIIAETFLTAWRRLDDIPGGEYERAWLYGVARRVLGNHHRGERRRALLGERLRTELTAATRVREPDSFEPGRGDAVAAFGALHDADREVLALAGWEGLDAGQIAVVLGCSRNAARIRLHRARRRLAVALHDHGVLITPELTGKTS
jgi:RNA polymerase sigma factor (sigma-70 family)